jgi:antitoxin (DNA-binding transcriptional repressor) of toxin-antitoxin stability system
MTRLNNATAAVLDAVERGEVFQIIRKGKPVGFLTPTMPRAAGRDRKRGPDWDAHFAWLKRQPVISPDAGDRGQAEER